MMGVPRQQRRGVLCSVWTLVLLASLAVRGGEDSAVQADRNGSAPFESAVQPVLAAYCVRCHGAEQQKGDRRFDQLNGDIPNDNALVELQDVLDQLNLSEMPPASAKQPTDDERRQVINWLTARIERYHQMRKSHQSQTVLRRLNAREYRHTVSDLLQLPMTMFDPTSTFPQDQTVGHLDNVGSRLVTSGYLLSRYLQAAEEVIDKALLPLEQPPVQTWVFRDGFRQQPEIDQVHRKTNKFAHMTLYDVIGADKHEGAYGPILAFKEGVPEDGLYELRVKAEAVNRVHPYDPEFLGMDPKEPLRLGVVAGNYRVGQLHKPQPIEPLLAETDLADEERWYTMRVWLDAGYTPRFTFQNGLMDARNLWGRLLKKYPEQFPKPERGGIVENRYNAIAYGKLPQIRIHEIEIRGPLWKNWPRPSQRALLGDDCAEMLRSKTMSDTRVRELLKRFLSRAYRRPAQEEDVKRILRVVEQREQAGNDRLTALADGFKAALCSPHFLYLEPPAQSAAAETRLTAHALANRLSYFLWASMPDEELFQLAANQRLLREDVLEAQVVRMLQDPKSDAFVQGFLDGWLTLRDLGASPPDRKQFVDFYRYDLGSAMRQETFLFTKHLIAENLDVVNFLDAEFTFANKGLARLYGVTPPDESGFQRIAFSDHRRGGLLGHASVLTVTANGIDTSPVVRGVWILENLLGTPPSPPPPDVEPIDPDVRGATTIRDQLRRHRTVASCNDCHRKIDPLGFALENFDPIGKWRSAYHGRAKVDASGEMPNGQAFADVQGLKRILVQKKDRFTRALVGKLLAYALGRQLTPADRPHIDQILEEAAKNGDGMRDILRLVVLSPAFRSP